MYFNEVDEVGIICMLYVYEVKSHTESGRPILRECGKLIQTN